MSSEPLESRIRSVIKAPASFSSAQIRDLIGETRAGLSEAQREAARLDAAALDLALDPDEIERAQQDAHNASFRVRRLSAALDSLADLSELRREQEAESQRVERFNAARAESDRCATEIRKRYPTIQRDLMELITLIASASAKVTAANADRPAGEVCLEYPEGIAFSYADSPEGQVVGYRPAAIAEMLIPDIKNWSQPVWPPKWHGGVAGRPTRQQVDAWLSTVAPSSIGARR